MRLDGPKGGTCIQFNKMYRCKNSVSLQAFCEQNTGYEKIIYEANS